MDGGSPSDLLATFRCATMERFGLRACDWVEAEEALTARGRWRLRAAWTCLKNSGEEREESRVREKLGFSSMNAVFLTPYGAFVVRVVMLFHSSAEEQ